ncbi:MAG TPA: hypothetical protein VFB80_08205 [Pirellulaceae bacterium]|nr:hypothetical protein [Pirellulaceae bacterium]
MFLACADSSFNAAGLIFADAAALIDPSRTLLPGGEHTVSKEPACV